MSADWGTIESSPEVFSTLLWQLGVKGLEVEDLWSLDSASLSDLQPIHAFIFLFRWRSGAHDLPTTGHEDWDYFSAPAPDGESRYFARQTVQNACGTLALLNATLNLQSSPVFQLGELLSNLKAFSSALDPETAGFTIEGSQDIRMIHNGFARNDPFLLEDRRKATDDDEVYHFITYLPIGNHLYELDGLREVPVNHGEIPEGVEWTEKAREVIETRIATYGGGELRFNLMALIEDRKLKYSRQIDTIQSKLSSSSTDPLSIPNLRSELEIFKDRLSDVETKREFWESDLKLRRHNFIGFIHALLGVLEREGQLEGRIEAAKKAMEERRRKGVGLED